MARARRSRRSRGLRGTPAQHQTTAEMKLFMSAQHLRAAELGPKEGRCKNAIKAFEFAMEASAENTWTDRPHDQHVVTAVDLARSTLLGQCRCSPKR